MKLRGFGALLALSAVLATVALVTPFSANARKATTPKRLKKVLVVTVTKGFRHDSIPVAEMVIKQLGDTTKAWETDYVRTDADIQEKMTAQALKQYDALIFANTTGVLPLPEPQALLDYIKSGKGFVAMHSGSDTFHEWPGSQEKVSPYIKMLGGEFKTHGRQCAIEAFIADDKHPALRDVAEVGKAFSPATAGNVNLEKNTSPEGGIWNAFDEIYILQNVDRENLHLLLWLDKHPNDGSKEANQPGEHLISWCRAYGKGRVFYTSLGHRKEMWMDKNYQNHIIGGIKFAIGTAKGSTTPTPLTKASQ